MTAAREILEQLRRLDRDQEDSPILIALDGGSGAGKTAVADELRRFLPDTVIVHCDDFFAANVAMASWEQMSAPERAARCIDWRRLRSEALYPLSRRRRASWRPFDFSRPSGLATETVTVEPASVVLVDGIYSGRPELADLMTFTVLVDAPVELRRARHDAREGGDESLWHQMWDPAEEHYLTSVRPPTTFDLVVRH
ncbi:MULTISPECIES: uridine kinase family protein [unclassified Pseudonocardia]|uniref:uridine kinase family protein n=1 Tax=unclassified Pseudonocardia TaxID=2619320 RepID=UPI0006CB7F96|nr:MULTISPECIES: hypothetical protein [unclassified Pseudonocardia]ALE86560.1 hypothetical protein XF36_28365 [Pseudonocardia sp. HH130629-09]ANY10788.1 hypothetical protein AFB00_30800 [Pseudonocardia sp. HH130630-07]